MACDPALFPIKIRRGIHYGPLTINCQDTNSAPVPLTGFSVFAVARPEMESPTEIDLAPTITDVANGVITIDLDDEATNQFALGAYVWDLVLADASGERLPPILAGPLTVIDYVSRE